MAQEVCDGHGCGVARLAKQNPVTVMARLALQRALPPEWIDEMFEQQRGTQYIRELQFSTTVELMAVVAMGLRPSLHAAAQAAKDLPVSVQALYDKVRRTAPSLVRALVQGSAARLAQVLQPLHQAQCGMVPGYQVRIVDGNHLPASEKRLKPLRGFRGAALPGQSLVVYDPDLNLVVDMLPGEDGHAQEEGSLMQSLQDHAQPGQLWIADRNFRTRAFLCRWQTRCCAFVVREHSRISYPQEPEPLRHRARIESGAVCEQTVVIDDDTKRLRLRRIDLHLDHPTEDGEIVIRLLTNLPASAFTAWRGCTGIAGRLKRCSSDWNRLCTAKCVHSVIHVRHYWRLVLRPSPITCWRYCNQRYGWRMTCRTATWNCRRTTLPMKSAVTMLA
jgi:hypothetical protein